MRLLADENIPRLVVEFISSRGHDAIGVGNVAPGIKDREALSVPRAVPKEITIDEI